MWRDQSEVIPLGKIQEWDDEKKDIVSAYMSDPSFLCTDERPFSLSEALRGNIVDDQRYRVEGVTPALVRAADKTGVRMQLIPTLRGVQVFIDRASFLLLLSNLWMTLHGLGVIDLGKDYPRVVELWRNVSNYEIAKSMMTWEGGSDFLFPRLRASMQKCEELVHNIKPHIQLPTKPQVN